MFQAEAHIWVSTWGGRVPDVALSDWRLLTLALFHRGFLAQAAVGECDVLEGWLENSLLRPNAAPQAVNQNLCLSPFSPGVALQILPPWVGLFSASEEFQKSGGPEPSAGQASPANALTKRPHFMFRCGWLENP